MNSNSYELFYYLSDPLIGILESIKTSQKDHLKAKNSKTEIINDLSICLEPKSVNNNKEEKTIKEFLDKFLYFFDDTKE